jgi:hypothetical protein
MELWQDNAGEVCADARKGPFPKPINSRIYGFLMAHYNMD